MADTAAAIGIHGFWGLSSTFDFAAAFMNLPHGGGVLVEEDNIIRILLVQPGDIRHAMVTTTRRLRAAGHGKEPPQIHFYVLESPLEVLARDIALWEVFMDFEVPIRQRANLFLELYGNATVQDRTSRYLERLGNRLRDLINRGVSTLDLMDLSFMKYRDKDELENIFKSYSRSTSFDTNSLRNQRMRGYYAERYDSRRALYDWDYHYGIHDYASLIHIKIFRDWRESGIAFEFGDQIYSEPNRTLMSYTEGIMKKGKDKGIKKEIRGFWGDIVCSPFFGFGIDCETPGKFEEGLFEILNKGTGTEQHRHHCVEIAVYYLVAMMWEAETGRPYKMAKAHDVYSGLGMTQGVDSTQKSIAGEEAGAEATASVGHTADYVEAEIALDNDASPPSELLRAKFMQRKREEKIAKEITRAEAIVSTFTGVKIFPMHGEVISTLDKSQFDGFFDMMFVSSRAAKFLESPVANNILRTDNSKAAALIAVETGKFFVPLLKKTKSDFLIKEMDYCENLRWSRLHDPPVFRRRRDSDDTQDDVIFYVKDQSNTRQV